MRRRIEVDGPVDVATAWSRYADLSVWPRWSPQIRAVDADGTHLVPGLHGLVRGPLGTAVPFRVDHVDEADLSWSWTVALAGLDIRMRHDLREHDGGTTSGLTMDAPPVVALTYGPPARVALRRLCRREI